MAQLGTRFENAR